MKHYCQYITANFKRVFLNFLRLLFIFLLSHHTYCYVLLCFQLSITPGVSFSLHTQPNRVHYWPDAKHTQSGNPHDRPYTGLPGRWQTCEALSPSPVGNRCCQTRAAFQLVALPDDTGSAGTMLFAGIAALMK